MKTTDSTMFNAYEWDEGSWTLTVVFRSNNKMFAYADVPPELYGEFDKAKSKGAFYNQHIKGKFEALKGGEVSDEDISQAVAETLAEVPAVPEEAIALAIAVQEAAEIATGADPAFITDADIKSVDPAYKPATPSIAPSKPGEWHGVPLPGAKTEESIGEILSKTENVGMSVPKASRNELQTLVEESTGLAATVATITSPAEYTQVSERLQRKMSVRDRLFGILDPVRKALWDALQLTRNQHGLILDPIDASIAADKKALGAWNAEQQRIAQEAQRKAQVEAEKAAAAEQQRQTEELRLGMAQQAHEAGDTVQAELLLSDETIVAAPVPVYAPRVIPNTPTVEGQSFRKNWKVERIDNFEELILDVAKGIESVRKTGNLQGHAPATMLEPNMPALNKRAKADERINLFPGVVAYNEPVLAQRRGK